MISSREESIITHLVGLFTRDQMANLFENLDYYLHPSLSVFVPLYRHCEYAVMPNHSHPAYSLIYNFNYNSKVLVEGKPLIVPSEKEHSICVFSPGVLHQEIVEEGFSNYLAIMIDKSLFESQMAEFIPDSRKWPLFKGDFFKADEQLLSLLKLFMGEVKNASAQSEKMVNGLVDLVVLQCVRVVLGLNGQAKTMSGRDSTDQAIYFMQENLQDKISVEELANQANMSTSVFSRNFKKHTGQTPIEFLGTLRIDKAKRLLRSSSFNLTQIALECGFTSLSYFSRFFTSEVKVSPSEYRSKFEG